MELGCHKLPIPLKTVFRNQIEMFKSNENKCFEIYILLYL